MSQISLDQMISELGKEILDKNYSEEQINTKITTTSSNQQQEKIHRAPNIVPQLIRKISKKRQEKQNSQMKVNKIKDGQLICKYYSTRSRSFRLTTDFQVLDHRIIYKQRNRRIQLLIRQNMEVWRNGMVRQISEFNSKKYHLRTLNQKINIEIDQNTIYKSKRNTGGSCLTTLNQYKEDNDDISSFGIGWYYSKQY